MCRQCCGLPFGCIAIGNVFAVFGGITAGLWMQELGIFRNNSPGAQWVNWIGEFSCGPNVVIVRPTSLALVQQNVKKYASVRAAATGHSFNFFACPADENHGAVLDMRHFQNVDISEPPRAKCETCSDDGDRFEVKAQAGIRMGQLQNMLLQRGLTLRVPPGNSAYTLGGCIATGCHNLGQSHAQDLLAVSLVLHNGSLREIRRGEPDFNAAAVSLGRLGVIFDATLEVLPYRTLDWASELLPMPETEGVWDILKNMTLRQTSRETVGNKLVFYLSTKVLMMEHWIPSGRVAVEPSAKPLKVYNNPQAFRLGQATFSKGIDKSRRMYFEMMPPWLLGLLQIPAEMIFRGLHSSPWLSGFRKMLGWQHSPEARGEANVKPTGNQYTYAGWLDEVMNLLMGLRHVEVIFPLEPKEQATKCLDIVFAHKHLAWWRLNVRTQRSEGFWMSSTHASADDVAKGSVFLRVDFVAPGALLEMPSGEQSLTARLHAECPGWRKHWGKALFKTAAEERWGEPEPFLEAVSRYDPDGKFKFHSSPSWLDR